MLGPSDEVERSQLRRQNFSRVSHCTENELESIASRANKSAPALCLHPVMSELLYVSDITFDETPHVRFVT